MAVASLLTASLIGTAKTDVSRNTYTAIATALSVATAYQVASANPEYVQTWANAFTGQDGLYSAAAAKANVADAAKDFLTKQVADLNELVTRGGIGGKHMATDGNGANDYNIDDLKALQEKLTAANTNAAQYAAELKASSNLKPSQKIGLLAATAYLGTFLTLAQLQVANIITQGPQWRKDSQDEAMLFNSKKAIVLALEGNEYRVLAKTAAVVEHLKGRYLAGILAGKGEAEAMRLEKAFFTEAHFETMSEIAADLFSKSVKRNATSLPERFKNYFGATPKHLLAKPALI